MEARQGGEEEKVKVKEEGVKVRAAARDIRDIVMHVGYRDIRKVNQHVNFIKGQNGWNWILLRKGGSRYGVWRGINTVGACSGLGGGPEDTWRNGGRS